MEPSTAEVEEDEYSFDDYTEEHEQLIQSIEASLVQPPPLTPWEKYRSRRGVKGLSVSDLTGPSWCETQWTYRLASKANAPSHLRPTSFQTSQGTTIPLDLKRSIAREVILDKGRVVHAVLEREVNGDVAEVVISTTSNEEYWTLRFLKSIVALEALITNGSAREIPVVGYVNDFLCFGVIDLIERREFIIPAATSTSKAVATDSPVSSCFCSPTKPVQTTLEDYFTPSPPSKSRKGKAKATDQNLSSLTPDTRWAFVIADTKTRHSNSLPPKADSRSSRHQLMIYHRLFSILLTSENSPVTSDVTPFPWSHFYETLALDPTASLSSAFLTSIAPILLGSSLGERLGHATTLADFITVLQSYDQLIRNDQGRILDSDLEISYRLRNTARGYKPRKTKKNESSIRRRKEPRTEEEEQIAMAIEESLRSAAVNDEAEEIALAQALALSSVVDQDEEMMYEKSDSGSEGDREIVSLLLPSQPLLNDMEIDLGTTQSITRSRYAELPPPARLRSPSPPPPDLEEGHLIGIETFPFDTVELDAWLASVTQLWRGERQPEGVSLDQTNRCRTCEFEDNCEWRSKKAQEIESGNRNKREVRVT